MHQDSQRAKHSSLHQALRNPTQPHNALFSGDDDADLRRRVLNFLAGRNHPGLRHLDVEIENGAVVLRGAVRSFYEKQLANHCCRRVAGVYEVVDDIDVIAQVELVSAS